MNLAEILTEALPDLPPPRRKELYPRIHPKVVVREYMEREKQDRERWAQTLEALDEVASGRTVPARSVHAWLRSWGSSKEPVPPRGKR